MKFWFVDFMKICWEVKQFDRVFTENAANVREIQGDISEM